jgi:hypothetical protein
MPRRNPRAKWVLPTIVHPAGEVCYTIRVPNEIQHIAAFLGAIYNLSSAAQWQDDTAHTAKDVAKVWQVIFDDLLKGPCSLGPSWPGSELEDNGMKLRIDPDDCSIIQVFNDCDQTWCNWYDPKNCGGINTGQQAGGGIPQPGSTTTYCQQVQANGAYLLPSPVSTGDSLVFGAFEGAWNDGTAFWYCPDGLDYVLGVCGGSGSTSGSDPLPTSLHMSLIMNIGGTYYPCAANSTFIVPGGVSNQNVTFQANDVSLSDNSGNISMCVNLKKAIAFVTVTVTSDPTNALPVPNVLAPGDTFTWTLTNVAGNYYSDVTFTPCCTIEFLSSNLSAASGSTHVGGTLCGGSYNNNLYSPQNFVGTTGSVQRIVLNGALSGGNSVTGRIVSIP